MIIFINNSGMADDADDAARCGYGPPDGEL